MSAKKACIAAGLKFPISGSSEWIGLFSGLGFAQTRYPVPVLPLLALPEQFNALKAFENVALLAAG